mmetsp:Transcript_4252/g.8921  ORF Transcript_4252/g.8921 Transcript_4252/m.8921 type:complete len:203 (+) Transcript_4252:1105-1713(+)
MSRCTVTKTWSPRIRATRRDEATLPFFNIPGITIRRRRLPPLLHPTPCLITISCKPSARAMSTNCDSFCNTAVLPPCGVSIGPAKVCCTWRVAAVTRPWSACCCTKRTFRPASATITDAIPCTMPVGRRNPISNWSRCSWRRVPICSGSKTCAVTRPCGTRRDSRGNRGSSIWRGIYPRLCRASCVIMIIIIRVVELWWDEE